MALPRGAPTEDVDDVDDAVDLDGPWDAAGRATASQGAPALPARPVQAPGRPGAPDAPGRGLLARRAVPALLAGWPQGTPPWLRAPLGTAAVAAVAAGLTGLLVGVRTSAVQDQRLQERQTGTVSVVLASGELVAVRVPDSSDYNTRATIDLQLVNAGPVPLTLVSASLGGDGPLVRAEPPDGQVLAPASPAHVVLSGPVRCPLDGAARTGAPTVVVRTTDGAEHERTLVSPATRGWSDALERACAVGVPRS